MVATNGCCAWVAKAAGLDGARECNEVDSESDSGMS